ncbi:glutamate--tRNA ligase family protein [Gemmatimonas groenlandica]|uniref:tRNA glutamyl-Q(34) synthetase GluQRS n=1 Tax=Gemmatimonas groenlandica TaxID=2732249 RepID=A0A6M4IMV2_9BACT|nr:glutamate--tRNA ligase family protein [Gemmatimonas groenlandica]QJR34736.1 tRNA glutamyl-Q(34) synthetase GluQRS [Gemmatimonas groenlandica]
MAWRTRFAPAPTGYLHLGHVVNALHVWGLARAFGGEVLLRIEDHDRTRCRDEYEDALLDDLDWLGFAPDIGSTDSFRAARHDRAHAPRHTQRQSDNDARYAAALAALTACGLTYTCTCTRRDIARHAPRAPGEEPRYPGTCRDAHHADSESLARRARMADGDVPFDDGRLGPVQQSPAAQCGDVLVRDRHGQWTYQFAVVVDDMAHDIDVVIRGEDLLASTGRQLRLAAMLERQRPLSWWHHPLLVHPDGSKLSKANHDTSIRERRAAGAHAAGLLGEAAFLSGLLPAARDLSIDELPALFQSGVNAFSVS